MDQGNIPKIFKDMRFYVQEVKHPKREELVLKLKSRGGIQIDQPNHPLCRVIFIFASNLQSYKIKGKAKPLETCLNNKTWTFHDLCTYFCRSQGDKEKRIGLVVDASWVDECIQRGTNIQSGRWLGKEIFVRHKDRVNIPKLLTPMQSALPCTAPNMASTPIDSPATRQSTGTPVLDIKERQDDLVEQVGSVHTSVPTKGPTPAAHTSPVDQPPPIFASFSQDGEGLHVFPHKGSAKLVASIIYFGGQVVDLEQAVYIIVDRQSACRVPPLKKEQHIIDATWIDDALETEAARPIKEYIIIPWDVSLPARMDEKPQVSTERGPEVSSQRHSSTAGRKRAATLTAGGPVAKIKRPGTPKASSASLNHAGGAPASVANPSNGATSVSHSFSGVFQIASEDDTPAQKASRKHHIDRVVNELDEWCDKDFEGTRTAFLISKRKEVNPEFDRVAFFSYNKKAILKSLSGRGRDVGLGSELYEGARRSGKASAVRPSVSGTTRPDTETSQSSGSWAPSATTSKSKQESLLIAVQTASTSMVNTSSTGTVAVSKISEALRRFFLPSGEMRRLGPLEVASKEERQRLLLAYMVDELDQWCGNESPGSRYAFLTAMNMSSPLKFDRNRLFTENKEAILQVLGKRGRQVHKGTKIYGESLKGPHKFVYNRRDGRETVLPQATSTTPGPSSDTADDAVAVLSRLSIPPADPASDTTRSTPATVATMATSLPFAPPQRKRAHSMSAPTWNKDQKQANLAQLVDEVQTWCQGSSRKARSTYLKGLTISKPGFDRVSLLKRNRDFVFQALAARNVDVSEGSRAHGIIVVGEPTFRSSDKHDKKESHTPLNPGPSPSRTSRRDTSAIGGSHPLPTPRPAFKTVSLSSQTSVGPIKSADDISQPTFVGLCRDPVASPYDVPLPFPVRCWVTPDNE